MRITEDDEVPEYLKKLPKGDPLKLGDGFGPEDIAWVGGELDVEVLTSEHGQDPFNPLHLLLFALISGNDPDARPHEIRSRTQKAIAAISGKPAPKGRPKSDYHSLLLEIAWLYFLEVYKNGMREKVIEKNGKQKKDIELLQIVKSVINRNRAVIERTANVDTEHLEKTLERLFRENKNLYLARATTDNDWGRMDGLSDLRNAMKLLSKAGIPIDQTAVKATRLAKNHKK